MSIFGKHLTLYDASDINFETNAWLLVSRLGCFHVSTEPRNQFGYSERMCSEYKREHFCSEDHMIVCRTSPLLRGEDLWKPLQMGIKWTELGIEEATDLAFTYKPDPDIHNITPNVSIIRCALLNFVAHSSFFQLVSNYVNWNFL